MSDYVALQQSGSVLMSEVPDTMEGHAEARGLGCTPDHFGVIGQ